MNELCIEIETMRFIPHRWLFRDDIDRILLPIIEKSSIYSLSIQKKVRFDLSSIDFIGNSSLSVSVSIAQEVKSIFVNCEDFDAFDEKAKNKKENNISPDIYNESSSLELVGRYIPTDGQPRVFMVPIESVIANEKYGLSLVNNIVYIGQSHKLKKRLQSHEKINRASAELGDEEELRLNFYEFRPSGLARGGVEGLKIGRFIHELQQQYHSKSSKSYADFITLVERFMIYFYKPIYNVQHKKSKLNQDKKVKRLLLSRGINSISIGLGMNGDNWTFRSDCQAIDSENAVFDFQNPKLDFHLDC